MCSINYILLFQLIILLLRQPLNPIMMILQPIFRRTQTLNKKIPLQDISRIFHPSLSFMSTNATNSPEIETDSASSATYTSTTTTSSSKVNPATRFNQILTPEEAVTDELLKTISLDTASSRILLADRVRKTIDRFKQHTSDTGSAGVQVAVATQRIANLARHYASHRKDHVCSRSFQMLVSQRRSMMKYLMNRDPKEFEKVVRVLGLEQEASLLMPEQRKNNVPEPPKKKVEKDESIKKGKDKKQRQ